MSNELLKSNSFGLFTFSSTSQALKAEKILKLNNAKFMIIPTLREISTSCGLSVKTAPDSIQSCFDELVKNKVSIEGVYRVDKQGTKHHVERLELM